MIYPIENKHCKCKSCGYLPTGYKIVGEDRYGKKTKLVDALGECFVRGRCLSCHNKHKAAKELDSETRKNSEEFVKCKKCSNQDYRQRVRVEEGSQYVYKNREGERWYSLNICPCCYKRFENKRNQSRSNREKEKTCVVCSKAFFAVTNTTVCSDSCKTERRRIASRENSKKDYKKHLESRPNKKCKTCSAVIPHSRQYCGKGCRPKQQHKYKPRRPTVKLCITCNKEHYRRVYCSRTCYPKRPNPFTEDKKEQLKRYRKSARARGKLKKKQACLSPKGLHVIYNNRPEGYEIDHIVPLNHPDVCGLHVSWNLQYLPKEENQVKSNQFDYTYDNVSWKKAS